MFDKQSLKNRFLAVESKLEVSKPEATVEALVHEKSSHPHIHAAAREFKGPEENLSFYIHSLKTSFKRVNVPAMPASALELEDEISELINSLSKKPCLVQLHHPRDTKGYEMVKLLIEAIEEQNHHWRILFKDQPWVALSFITSMATMSFAADKIDSQKVEGLMRTICSKSSSLVSFNVQRKDGQLQLSLRLEANLNKKFSSERDAGL